MKHLVAFAVIAVFVLVGCNKNKKPAAQADTNAKITDIAPPPPVHQPVTQQPVIQPVVTPVADPTPAVTKTETPAAGGPTAGKPYTVQKGDTLWGIAQRTYGDGKQYRKIVAANPSIKGDKLAAGQKIVLP